MVAIPDRGKYLEIYGIISDFREMYLRNVHALSIV